MFASVMSAITNRAGPYAAIYDLSMTNGTTTPSQMVRNFARRRPPIPRERKQVVMEKETHMYGLARLFQICGDNVGREVEVVHTLEEAYDIVGARPEDFTQRLFREPLAA
jgi:hypothetical protein